MSKKLSAHMKIHQGKLEEFERQAAIIFGEPRKIVPTFESQGVKLFYKDKGNGQPIVFVHGSLSDYRVWSAQTEALSLNFRTISYSRRYAHPNEREVDMMDSTVQNNSTDLEALIRGLKLERAHLVGHSCMQIQKGKGATYGICFQYFRKYRLACCILCT